MYDGSLTDVIDTRNRTVFSDSVCFQRTLHRSGSRSRAGTRARVRAHAHAVTACPRHTAPQVRVVIGSAAQGTTDAGPSSTRPSLVQAATT